MAESEEEDQYQSDGDQWSQREESLVLSDEEADYESPPWPGDDDLSSYYGEESDKEELEPDPPYYSRVNTNQSAWYRDEETDREEGVEGDQEGDTWPEETESQHHEGDYNTEPEGRDDSEHRDFAHGEEGQTLEPYQRPWCEITDSEISSRDGDGFDGDDEPWDHESEQEEDCVDKSEHDKKKQDQNKADNNNTTLHEPYNATTDDEADYEPHHIYFSGHNQGPEAYLQWENDMEHWFRSINIPKEERLNYAINSLNGEASTWWIQEEALANYKNSAFTWGNIKQLMYREFVQKSHNRSYTPKRSLFQTTTTSWIPTPKLQPVSKHKLEKACFHIPKKALQNTLEKKTEVKKPERTKEAKPAPKEPDTAHTQSTKPKHETQGKEKQCLYCRSRT
ncbi:uncharacterized protein LOC112088945 isoform X2 [Eutrema salsugineum]|uniref:uncharacterized protein LOC112088945 isoform X2 n=1 Tax=Eutrema salsugineum TaxID=72664 RepID=UPI000CED41A7|nr:uncharacterized protein LOC112088945 isoform X2 [Eutrema salsugineum]